MFLLVNISESVCMGTRRRDLRRRVRHPILVERQMLQRKTVCRAMRRLPSERLSQSVFMPVFPSELWTFEGIRQLPRHDLQQIEAFVALEVPAPNIKIDRYCC